MPVVLATQEAETGGSHEPRRQSRLQWAEITSLPSNLGNKSETHLKTKTQMNKNPILCYFCKLHTYTTYLFHVSRFLYFLNLGFTLGNYFPISLSEKVQ